MTTASGTTQADRAMLVAVRNELMKAEAAYTQNAAMTHMLWAQHLLATLLRRMQDD